MGCARECKEKHETTMYGWGLGVGLAVASSKAPILENTW